MVVSIGVGDIELYERGGLLTVFQNRDDWMEYSLLERRYRVP